MGLTNIYQATNFQDILWSFHQLQNILEILKELTFIKVDDGINQDLRISLFSFSLRIWSSRIVNNHSLIC